MVVVATTLGRIKGLERDGSSSFLGIPYAEAPVGELRWHPPVAYGSWEGELDATAYPNRAFQPPLPESLGNQDIPGAMSEDCLYLNVHTPAADGAKRPVLVWIHGGGFIQGSANDFDPTPFVRKYDVVVVAMNYRIGLLGFLDLSRFGPAYAGSAALGFQDQIEALCWIRSNIADYGGDPESITISGASAGGGSVLALLGAPSAKGLFRRAIAWSPGEIPATPPDVITPVANGLGLDEQALLDQWRAMPAADLFKFQTDGGIGATCGVDGAVIAKPAFDAIKEGINPVPLITGTCIEEGTMLTPVLGDNPAVYPFFEAGLAPTISRGNVAEYSAFVNRIMEGATPAARMNRVWYDSFRAAAVRAAQATTESDLPGWLYSFEVPTDHEYGPTHASDMPFAWSLFENPADVDNPSPSFHPDTPENRALAEIWSAAFARFVHDGDPNGDGLPAWPVYDAASRACLVLRERATVVENPDGDAVSVYGIG